MTKKKIDKNIMVFQTLLKCKYNIVQHEPYNNH